MDISKRQWLIIVLFAMAWGLLFGPMGAHGASEWDKSSLTATGACQAGGVLVVTVTNTGQSMTAPVAWRFVVDGAVTSSGAVQLGANDTATLQSLPAPNKVIDFSVDQSAGHPGTGIVRVSMSCSPNAVTLSSFGAQDSGQVARNVVLVVLVVATLLLARWALREGKR